MQGGLLSDVITSALLINRLTAEPVTLFILQSLSIRNLPLRYKRGGRVLFPLSHYRSDRRLLTFVATLSLFMTTPT